MPTKNKNKNKKEKEKNVIEDYCSLLGNASELIRWRREERKNERSMDCRSRFSQRMLTLHSGIRER